ncbi:MAG TPA: flippase [Desulfobacterales bacterium]|nr:flippase [Desulfobacterales bacterium]
MGKGELDKNAKELGAMKRDSQLQISGTLLGRNTLLNFWGQAMPLVIGVITIPFIVRGLGTERFGLLSLSWVILGYFSIFDLGLGRATTKFVAEALGKGESAQLPRLVWTAVTAQTILGFLGVLILLVITPVLVERVLNIPSNLLDEAKATFHMLAFAIPVVLVSGSFRGVLEAAQRFELVNVVKVPSSTLTFLLPLVGLFLGFRLPGIVALMVAARFGELAAFVALDLRIFTQLRKPSTSFNLFPRLFGYGGWIMVNNIINPVLTYLDRFLIGSFLSMAAVAHYSAPYEGVTRLRIIPASLSMTLFSAFSFLEGIEDREKLNTFFARSVKYILLSLGPIIVMLILFAKQIMQVWLGSDFARESAGVLQILALGVLLNSLAYIPSALLSGAGRPDIPAKIHLLELPFYVALAWVFVQRWGIEGAAGVWTLRVGVDACLLFLCSFRAYRLPTRLLTINGIPLAGGAVVGFGVLIYGVKSLVGTNPWVLQMLVLFAICCLYAWFTWRWVLDRTDQQTIWKTLGLLRRG